MAIDLQNPQNIASGWGRPPDFSAPSIGSLVSGILENRYRQQKLQQDSVAEAIKQYQSQRSDAAYIQAAQNAGVLPQGDYSGMTAAEASNLAQRIQDMTPDTDADKLKQAMARHYDYLTGGGGRGGGGSGSATPNTYWDDQGREWRPGPGGRWIPIKPSSPQTPAGPKLSPTEKGWAAPEIPGVSVDINAPDEPAQTLQPDVPSAPSGGTSTPPPSDTAGGHAPDYGTSAPNKPVTPGEQIDPATVQQYILKNNGDRDAARQDARKDGWSF